MARLMVVGSERSVGDIRSLVGESHEVELVTPAELESRASNRSADLLIVDLRRQSAAREVDAALHLRKIWGVPLVFVTRAVQKALLARIDTREPFGYVLEPFTEREFKHAIDAMLCRRWLRVPLDAREHWLATTLKSVGDAILTTDVDDRVSFMNPMAETLTGWKESEALGRPSAEILQLVSPDGRRMSNPLERVGKTLGAVVLEPGTLLRTRSGVEIPIDDSLSPILDGSAVRGAVVVFRDISERKKLEARLALSERLAGFGAITAAIAHEINNPLAYNLTNCGLALRETEALRAELARGSPADSNRAPAFAAHLDLLEQALHGVQDGAERVRRIVADLKVLSAPPEHKPPEVFAIEPVLDAAARMAGNEIRHRARFVREVRARPCASGSEVQLVQVVLNLLINAAQAIPEGALEKNEIKLVLDVDAQGNSVIEVHDTGSGIPPEVMVHIFDPFFTTKPTGLGSGLGLSISHDLIAAQGGTLTAVSIVGQGSVFRIQLPRCEAPASTSIRATPATPVPPLENRRGRVLLVDDEPMLTAALRHILLPRHDVEVAETAQAVLERLNAGERFDVILCDVMLPGMSSFELYGELRARHPEHAERTAFATGGAFTPEAEAFLRDIPENRVLLKPFGLGDLESLIAALASSEPPPDA